MKALGFSAIAVTVLSFLLWLVNWTYWTYQQFAPYGSATYESQRTIQYVFRVVSVLATLTEYLAILLIAIALVMAANRLMKT